MARQLADAGIDMLIEKPLSTTFTGLEELQRSSSVTACMSPSPMCCDTIVRCLVCVRRFAQAGSAQPVQLVAVTGQLFPNYWPAGHEIYYRDRSTAGGAIQDALTHLINAAEWLVGPVQRLVADAAYQLLEGVEVEDTAHVLARHDGDLLAAYSLNQYQAPNEAATMVVCERSTCRWQLHRHRWRWMTEPDGPCHEQSFPGLEGDELFIDQANAFLDYLEGSGAPRPVTWPRRPVHCRQTWQHCVDRSRDMARD